MRNLLFLLFGLLLVGCKDSGVNEPKMGPEDNILIFEGNTLIPHAPDGPFFEEDKKLKGSGLPKISEEQMKALKGMILNYSKKKKTPYVAFIGSKKNKKYKYKYFKLIPNENSIEESNGEDFFYYILFIDPQIQEAYKILAARIPYTSNQKQAIKDWAKNLSGKKNGWTSNKEGNANKVMSCSYVEDIIVWDEEIGSYNQYSGWVCTDNEQFEPGGDGGGSGGCHYEPGGCQEDPNPNDPPFGGGGSNGDDNDPCPDGYEKDALGNCILIQPNPEPCNTNNPLLDNQYIQTKLDELWKDTNYGLDSNPNPENQRKEQVAIIAPNGYGGYQFLQLNVLASACQAKIQIPANLPVGSILVHTHPYANGDLQLDCIPGQVFKYRNKPGIEDRPTLEKTGIEQGIILDAEKIIIFTPDQSETPTLIDRCGY